MEKLMHEQKELLNELAHASFLLGLAQDKEKVLTSQIESYQRNERSMKENYQFHTEETESLQKTVSSLQLEVQIQVTQNRELTTIVEELRKEKAELSTLLSDTQRANSNLRQDLNNLLADQADMKAEVHRAFETAVQDINKAESMRSALEADNKSLRDELASLKANHAEIEASLGGKIQILQDRCECEESRSQNLLNELNSTKQKLLQAQDTNARYSESMEEANQLIASLRTDLSVTDAARDISTAEIKMLHERLATMQEEIVNKNLKIESMQQSLSAEQIKSHHLADEVSIFQDQIARLNDEIRRKASQLLSQQQALSADQSTVHRLDSENAALQSKIQQLTETMRSKDADFLTLQSSLSMEKASVHRLESERTSLQENLSKLEEDLRLKATEAMELQQSLFAKENVLHHLESEKASAEGKLSRIVDEIKSKESQIFTLQQSLLAEQGSHSQLEAYKNSLDAQLLTLQEKVSSLNNDMIDKDAVIANLKLDNEQVKRAFELKSKEFSDSMQIAETTHDRIRADLHRQIDTINQELESNKMLLTQSRSEYARLDSELRTLSYELKLTKVEVEEAKSTIAMLRQEKLSLLQQSQSTTSETILQLQDSLTNKTQELIDLKRELSKLQNENSSFLDQCNQLMSVKVDLEHENSSMMRSYQDKLASANDELSKLSLDNQQLQQRLSKMKALFDQWLQAHRRDLQLVKQHIQIDINQAVTHCYQDILSFKSRLLSWSHVAAARTSSLPSPSTTTNLQTTALDELSARLVETTRKYEQAMQQVQALEFERDQQHVISTQERSTLHQLRLEYDSLIKSKVQLEKELLEAKAKPLERPFANLLESDVKSLKMQLQNLEQLYQESQAEWENRYNLVEHDRNRLLKDHEKFMRESDDRHQRQYQDLFEKHREERNKLISLYDIKLNQLQQEYEECKQQLNTKVAELSTVQQQALQERFDKQIAADEHQLFVAQETQRWKLKHDQLLQDHQQLATRFKHLEEKQQVLDASASSSSLTTAAAIQKLQHRIVELETEQNISSESNHALKKQLEEARIEADARIRLLQSQIDDYRKDIATYTRSIQEYEGSMSEMKLAHAQALEAKSLEFEQQRERLLMAEGKIAAAVTEEVVPVVAPDMITKLEAVIRNQAQELESYKHQAQDQEALNKQNLSTLLAEKDYQLEHLRSMKEQAESQIESIVSVLQAQEAALEDAIKREEEFEAVKQRYESFIQSSHQEFHDKAMMMQAELDLTKAMLKERQEELDILTMSVSDLLASTSSPMRSSSAGHMPFSSTQEKMLDALDGWHEKLLGFVLDMHESLTFLFMNSTTDNSSTTSTEKDWKKLSMQLHHLHEHTLSAPWFQDDSHLFPNRRHRQVVTSRQPRILAPPHTIAQGGQALQIMRDPAAVAAQVSTQTMQINVLREQVKVVRIERVVLRAVMKMLCKVIKKYRWMVINNTKQASPRQRRRNSPLKMTSSSDPSRMLEDYVNQEQQDPSMIDEEFTIRSPIEYSTMNVSSASVLRGSINSSYVSSDSDGGDDIWNLSGDSTDLMRQYDDGMVARWMMQHK
jgi:chromosome segregation ATPase